MTTTLTDWSAASVVERVADLVAQRDRQRVPLRGPVQRERRVLRRPARPADRPRAMAQSPWRALEEPGPLHDDPRDAARGDETAGVADRDPERQPPALDRSSVASAMTFRPPASARGGRAAPGSRRSWSFGAARRRPPRRSLPRRARRRAACRAPARHRCCIASEVSASATSDVTDPERPGFTPMAVR